MIQSTQKVLSLIQDEIKGNIIVGDKNVQIGSNYGVLILQTEQQPEFESLLFPDLPLPRKPELVGRQDEITIAVQELQTAFQTDQPRPVELYGKQGIGKTTLLEYMCHHEVIKSFPNRVVYLRTYGQYTAEDLLQNLVNTFYTCNVPTILKPLEVRRKLQTKKAVILLDDVDLPLDEIHELLNAAPTFSFLLGSHKRHLIRKSQGRAVFLRGLSLQDTLELVKLELGTLTPEECAAIEMIHTALEGHPENILLAIVPVQEEQCSLIQIAQKLKGEDSPQKALTMLLLPTLSLPEKKLVELLATQNGIPFHIDHLKALTKLPDIGLALEKLQWYGLVQADNLHYSLVNTLTETMPQMFDLTAWSEQTLSYLTTWAKTQVVHSPRLLEEWATIVQSLNWGVGAGHWAEVIHLVRAIEGTLALSQLWGVWEKVLHWGLQAAQALNDHENIAWAMHQLGSQALCLEKYDLARNLLVKALRLRTRLGDRIGVAVTRHNLSFLMPPPLPQDLPKKQPNTPKSTLFRSAINLVLSVIMVGLLIIWVFFILPSLPPLIALSPTPTNISTPTPTQTETPTFTPTAIPTFTSIPPTPTPTLTHTPTPTLTPTPTPTPIPPTSTPKRTATRTPKPTPTRTPSPLPDTNPPTVPQPIRPDNRAEIPCTEGQPIDFYLRWSPSSDVSGIRGYDVVLQSNQKTVQEWSLSNISQQVMLTCNTSTYQWRVRAKDGVGNISDWATSTFNLQPSSMHVPPPEDTPIPSPTITPTPTVPKTSILSTSIPTNTPTFTPTPTNTPTSTPFTPISILEIPTDTPTSMHMIIPSITLTPTPTPTVTPISTSPTPNLSVPVLIEPRNQSTISCNSPSSTTSIPVSLKWNPVQNGSGIIKYVIEYRDSYITQQRIEQTSWTQFPLSIPCGTTTYWKVKAIDSTGRESGWSEEWFFDIEMPTPTNTPTFTPTPTNTPTYTPTPTNTPTFTPMPTDTPTFTPTPTDTPTITPTDTPTITPIPPTITPTPTLPAPILIAPRNQSTPISCNYPPPIPIPTYDYPYYSTPTPPIQTIPLSWYSVQGSTIEYVIEYHNNYVSPQTIRTNFTQYQLSVSCGTRIYWRVKAVDINTNRESSWSEEWYFIIN